MSTLKVNAIESQATDSAPTIAGLQYPTDGPLSNRNLIINGAMQVAQRGTATVTGSGKYPVDRFRQNSNTAAVVTAVQSAATPAGFLNSIKLENTSADSSIDAGDAWSVQQIIEGYNIQHLNWGTADAKNVTVSFWARSSQTGTFCLILLGSSNGSDLDKSYVSEYTIDTANTFEYKSITVPGPTSGTAWSNSNNRGLCVRWGLSCGTDEQQAAGSWGTVNASGSSNQTQLLSTANSTFYLTGVQVEVGDTATPFENRSYGDELARCQRYYINYRYGESGAATTDGMGFYGSHLSGTNKWQFAWVYFPTTMRAQPAVKTSDKNGNEEKISLWTSSAGALTNNSTPYSVNPSTDRFAFSDYLNTKYGIVLCGYKADAEL